MSAPSDVSDVRKAINDPSDVPDMKKTMNAIMECTELSDDDKASAVGLCPNNPEIRQAIVFSKSTHSRAKTIRKMLETDPNVQAAKMAALKRECVESGIEVDPRVIRRIRTTPMLQRMFSMASPNELVEVYHEARRIMGSSTKNEIIAQDPSGLSINGLFEGAHSESSVFYQAFVFCRPHLLKMPNVPSSAFHEYNVYSTASKGHPGKECLVKVDIVQLKLKEAAGAASSSSSSAPVPRAPSHRLPSNVALLMNYFHSTLFSFPSNVLGVHKMLMDASDRVMLGLDALHASGYVHCDVKPGNIFFDASSGQFFLGDYDAVVKIGQPVKRTTDAYLPAEFAALRNSNNLQASPSIDYAMLAFTLAERCALPYHETHSESSSSSSHVSLSPRLFFNLFLLRRNLSTLRSCAAAESQRLKAILATQHSNPTQSEPDPIPILDMQRRCDLMQEITKIVDKVEKHSTQVKEGRQLADLQLAQGQASSSLTPATLSSHVYEYPF